MKEESALMPLMFGMILALIASHITPTTEPTVDMAGLVLLVASHLFIVTSIIMFCAACVYRREVSKSSHLEAEDA